MRSPLTTSSSFFFFFIIIINALAQDYDSPGGTDDATSPPKEASRCNGIFATYTFEGREKEYPFVKNVTAQPWSFAATATVLNTGSVEVKAWQLFIGFQHREMLVSADGAVVVGGDSFPIQVGNNGTTLAGYPMADLKTAVDTASDYTQMQAQISLKGTQFGMGEKGTPMPKSLKIVNPGFKCPAATRKGSYMYTCCRRDPKFKLKSNSTKFFPRQSGDLTFTYDVLKAYDNKYTAQVTMDNNHPLGRLDQWNLTWEWMRNEFINTMRGAYTHTMDPSDCIYGPQGQYYKEFDFSTVMNCEKKPVISDLPPEKENDDNVGRLPFCCKNGIVLPKTMNETKARAIFQLEVFKLPPDMNRTAITPPQNWKIIGRLSPNYKCGPPVRIDPDDFPDPKGTPATTSAIASWQVACNMTRPKPKQAKCCVSYSAYYSDAAIPCNTCACGCDEDSRCDKSEEAILLPPNALLVPFDNRAELARAFAEIHHRTLPRRLPCPDNCGVSINWHIDSDYKTGWTSRMTVFNWEDSSFADWFAAIQMRNKSFPGFEKVYSLNGTALTSPKNTVFMQGLPGSNYLMGEVNGSKPESPCVPGKQQTVIQFSKKHIQKINVLKGDGFPLKVFFNGEECDLPTELPKRSDANGSRIGLIRSILAVLISLLILRDHLR